MTRAGRGRSPDHTTWSLDLQTQALQLSQCVKSASLAAVLSWDSFFLYMILLSNVLCKCCIHMYHDICTEFFICTSSLSVFDIKDKYK